MTNLKRCSVAMAALLVSSLPALAQDDGMATTETDDGMMLTMDGDEETGDMAGNGLVTFEFDDDQVRLPLGIAAQFCETTASELAQGMRDGIECEITEEEARQINFPGFTGDGMTDDDDDDNDDDGMTEEEREAREQEREEEREMRQEERDDQAEERKEERGTRQEERKNDEEEEEERDHWGR